VAFLSALLHPFEIFVIVAASTVPLLLHRRIMAWIALGISAGVGMLPYIVTAARTEWVRDASETLHTSLHPFWLLANFGIPCFLTVYLLLLRFRMPAIGDTVLRSWFFSLPVLLLIPGIPFPLHLQDGFAYCIGFLLVRRIACDPQLRSALEKHRNVARAGFGALLGMSAVALALFYVQVWQDGRRADPQLRGHCSTGWKGTRPGIHWCWLQKMWLRGLRQFQGRVLRATTFAALPSHSKGSKRNVFINALPALKAYWRNMAWARLSRGGTARRNPICRRRCYEPRSAHGWCTSFPMRGCIRIRV
jgi:hypothetical protein